MVTVSSSSCWTKKPAANRSRGCEKALEGRDVVEGPAGIEYALLSDFFTEKTLSTVSSFRRDRGILVGLHGSMSTWHRNARLVSDEDEASV